MASYRFQVLGPFPVPVLPRRKGKKRSIDFDQARDGVFAAAGEACGDRYDIYSAIGLYVFGLSPPGSSRTRPYYVGEARGQTLYKRTFQPIDKPDLYNDILNWYTRAAPFVYLLPLLTPSGALARLGSNERRINLAEQTLIGMALRANPDVWNIRHRAAIESFSIDGVPGSKHRTTPASAQFAAMLNRDPPKKAAGAKAEKLPSPAFTHEVSLGENVAENSTGSCS